MLYQWHTCRESKDGSMARKHKLPKRIGGVKIPKEWRRTAEDVLDRVDTPIARELAATAAVAIGAAIARAEAARQARQEASRPEAAPGEPVQSDPTAKAAEKSPNMEAAGAKFAATAAGLAATALDGWLNKRVRPANAPGDRPVTPPPGAASH